jgi:hypothetical protein
MTDVYHAPFTSWLDVAEGVPPALRSTRAVPWTRSGAESVLAKRPPVGHGDIGIRATSGRPMNTTRARSVPFPALREDRDLAAGAANSGRRIETIVPARPDRLPGRAST